MARRSTNAFGEAWQGSKIQGAGSLARARGYAYGALTSQQRGEFGSQANFQAAAEQAAQRNPSGETDQQRENPIQNYLRKLRPANPSGETDQQREERLKKKGRDEVMTRDPEYVKKPEPMAKSETARAPRPPQQAAQNKYKAPSMGGRWSDGLMGYGSNAAPKPRAPGSLKLLGDTSPAALAKIRRAINRREQRPSYTPSGQVIRGGW